jgi:hypothetical protein
LWLKQASELGLNTEKLMTLRIEPITVIDSYALLSSSLDKLVSQLKDAGLDNFKHMKAHYPDDCELMLFNGV